MKNITILLKEMNLTAEEEKDIRLTLVGLGLTGTICTLKTDEDFINWVHETLKAIKETKIEKEVKEAKKLEKKINKAKEQGLTLEEYEAIKKKEAKAKRYNAEIKRMEKQIEELQKEIFWRKRKIQEIHRELKEG